MTGTWAVQGVGIRQPTTLVIDIDLVVHQSCGDLIGGWDADKAGLFVADTDGYSGSCTVSATDLTPAWLADVVRFRVDGADRELVDAAGHQVARLTPVDVVDPNEFAIEPYASMQAVLTATPELPPGVLPVSASELLGVWVPATPGRVLGAFLSFAADHSVASSDGCNGQGGRWVLGDGGDFVDVQGPNGAVGCVNGEITLPFGAVRVGLDGATLVFVDADGKQVGRFVRGTLPRPPGPATLQSGLPASPGSSSPPPHSLSVDPSPSPSR
jgi:hypothetical protein